MDEIELHVKMSRTMEEAAKNMPAIMPLPGFGHDGQSKRRERRKHRVKDNSRWHMKKQNK